MSIPLETFSIAKRLAEHLNLAFSIAENPKMKGYSDAQIIVLLIIVCKLRFDLEKTLAWIYWATVIEDETKKDHIVELEDVTKGNIFMMQDVKLNKYIDWIEWLYNKLEINCKQPVYRPASDMFISKIKTLSICA